MKVFRTPFTLQGSKEKLIPLIKSVADFDKAATWIEPFMGSGIVGLNLAPKNAIFSDLNPHIINFYNMLKEGVTTPDQVISYLLEEVKNIKHARKVGNDQAYFLEVRDRFNKFHNPIDFLLLNKMSFNGKICFNKAGNLTSAWGGSERSLAKIENGTLKAQIEHFWEKIKNNNWTFLHQPFETTLANADRKSFIYCDPPYIERKVGYVGARWNKSDEQRLHDSLISSGARFLLSSWLYDQRGNHNQYIRSIWGNCEYRTYKHYYGLGGKWDQKQNVTEIILSNYPIDDKPQSRLVAMNF